MHTTPFVLRGLLACTAVATLLIGGSAVATAQSDEEVVPVPVGTVSVVTVDLTGVPLELTPPITGDLTGEGGFVGAPSGPVVVAPAPVASPPQKGAAPAVTAPGLGTVFGEENPVRTAVEQATIVADVVCAIGEASQRFDCGPLP